MTIPPPGRWRRFIFYIHTHTLSGYQQQHPSTHSLSESYLGLFFSPLFLPTNNISPSIFPFTKTVWTVERLCRSSRRRRESNKDTTQGETCAIWSDWYSRPLFGVRAPSTALVRASPGREMLVLFTHSKLHRACVHIYIYDVGLCVCVQLSNMCVYVCSCRLSLSLHLIRYCVSFSIFQLWLWAMISFDSGVISSSSLAPFLSLMFIAEQPEDVKGGSLFSLSGACVTSTVKYWEAMGSRIPKAPWTLTSLSYKPPPSQNRDNY